MLDVDLALTRPDDEEESVGRIWSFIERDVSVVRAAAVPSTRSLWRRQGRFVRRYYLHPNHLL